MKRFERSNGLDTALYKNYLYLLSTLLAGSRPGGWSPIRLFVLKGPTSSTVWVGLIGNQYRKNGLLQRFRVWLSSTNHLLKDNNNPFINVKMVKDKNIVNLCILFL